MGRLYLTMMCKSLEPNSSVIKKNLSIEKKKQRHHNHHEKDWDSGS